MSPPDGVTGDTRYFKTDEIENKIVSFLDNTQTICVSPVRNKENEFHRQDPIRKWRCNIFFHMNFQIISTVKTTLLLYHRKRLAQSFLGCGTIWLIESNSF